MPETATDANFSKTFRQRQEESTFIICNAINESREKLKSTIHKEWERFERHWRDRPLPKIYPFRGCANFSVNITSSNIDGMTPRLVEDIFDYNEPIEAVAVDIQDNDGELASTINRFLSWDIESNDDLREEYWHCIEGAEVRGVAFAWTYWESEKDWIETEKTILVVNGKDGINPKTGEPIEIKPGVIESLQAKGYQVEEKQVIVKEFKYKKFGPKTVCLDPRDITYNKDAISPEDAFNNGFLSIKVKHSMDEIKRIVTADPESIFSDYKKFENELKNSSQNQTADAWKPKKIEFELVFTREDIDGDGLEEKVIKLIHLETKTLIGMQKFPYDHGECPIVAFRIKPIHKKICGVGIAEMLWHEKEYLDSIRNQMCDNRTLHNSQTRMYTKESEFNPAIHKTGYGATWLLKDISENAIKIESVQPIHNDLWNEFSALKSEANQRVGMSEINKGSMPEQAMTFRGMMMLSEEGSKSRGMFKRHIAQGVQKVEYQRLRLYQQNWGKKAREDKQIQTWINHILGENSKVFTSAGDMDVLDHRFNIVLKATHDDKKINAARTSDTTEFLMKFPEVQQNPKIKRKLIIDQLRANGIKNADELFPTVDELEALEQNRVTIAQRQIAEEQAQAQVQKDQEIEEALKAKDEGEIKEIHDKTFNQEVGRLEIMKELGLMNNIENAEAEQNNEMATIEKEM